MEYLSTLSKSAKAETGYSERTKHYIRVYSAHRRAAQERRHNQTLIHSKNHTTPKKTSIELSRSSFKLASFENLQTTAKSLLYDLNKASSDKTELIRDISTYDYNFSQNSSLAVTLQSLNSVAKPLLEAAGIIETSTATENLYYQTLLNGLAEISSIKIDRTKSLLSEQECFNTRKVNSAQLISTVFKGTSLISGQQCFVSITSDKWLENLRFKVKTLDCEIYSLNITQTISNSFYTNKEIISQVRSKLLPFLCFQLAKQQISLIFDSSQGIKYYSMLLKVKGLALCNIFVIFKSDSQVILEVPIIEQSILVDIKYKSAEGRIIYQKITKEVKIKLIYCKKHKMLIWGAGKDVFELLEKDSVLFNDEYIKSTMDMGIFKQLYSFDLIKFNVKIACLVYKDRVLLKVAYNKEVVEIDSLSKHYSFLQDLQFIDIIHSPQTLSCSLEIENLIFKLFPQLNTLGNLA